MESTEVDKNLENVEENSETKEINFSPNEIESSEAMEIDTEENFTDDDKNKEELITHSDKDKEDKLESSETEIKMSELKKEEQESSAAIDQETSKEKEDTKPADDEESSKQLDEKKTPKKQDSEPDDIINLLKSLSPEKLKEIKSKLFECTTSESKSTESVVENPPEKEAQNSKEKADENPPEQEIEETQKDSEEPPNVEQSATDDAKDDDVICLDSDDENSAPAKEPEESSTLKIEATSTEEVKISPMKRKTETTLNGEDVKRLKECINPECPRNSGDEFLECPSFVLSMHYVARKPNKSQWACSTCYQSSIETYEKLCTNLTNNEPWFKVKVPKKQDLVEIIDSDEENEQDEKSFSTKKELCDSEMIVFDEETEKEVEDIITEITAKIDIHFQREEEEKHLNKRMKKIDHELEKLLEDCRKLEQKSFQMYNDLYAFNRPRIERRPSLDLELCLSENGEVTARQIPKMSEAAKSPSVSTPTPPSTSAAADESSKLEQICYAIRQRGTSMPHWMPCKIIEDLSTSEEKRFKVQFCDNMANSIQIVSGKEISSATSSDKLEIGARVIALFPRVARNRQQIAAGAPQKRFLPGVIGEKLTQYNKRRYLVFCDYGQVKYCSVSEVREIQEASADVWNDVHPNLRQFIRDYLESKTNRSRALLNVRVNTQIMTERGGNWRKTIVQEIDCSLVHVYFVQEHISEWLYRGSKRLYTMFQQAQRAQGNMIQRRNDPTISFIEIDDDERNADGEVKRNIAKKSTGNKSSQQQVSHQMMVDSQKVIILNDDKIYLEDPAKVAVVKHFTPKKEICPKKFVTHECSQLCIPPLKNNLSTFVPLAKPLLTCWERQVVRHKANRCVLYKAPCGRRLRNYLEVFRYLQDTKCFLNIESFDFDPDIHVLSMLVVDQKLCGLFIPDIAAGKEGMKIQCINAFDDQRPPPLEYSPNRIPMPGVNINTDPEFMSCCDCTDECYDKSKCACFQLTIQGAKYKNLMEEDPEDISYVWKRLLTAVPTGIYECNSRCSCSKRCLNKVVQHPIQVKMQLFRTKSRGWGLQSLQDIPKGMFICIYAGNLYTEKDANALCQGQDHGDEYFAELDLIENAEARKEGFESGVVNPDESDQEEKDSDSDYDERKDTNEEDDYVCTARNRPSVSNREIVTRSSRTSSRNEKKTSASSTPQRSNSSDSSDDEMVNMMPNTLNALTEGMRVPFRRLYGPKEKVPWTPYVMDAKKCGNIGRYFNHSCDPNLFVQSVFVDTHDLRFPWIAFFAMRVIRAGEELTWNYNYEVGSVPSKVLYCKCGTKKCRGRIL